MNLDLKVSIEFFIEVIDPEIVLFLKESFKAVKSQINKEIKELEKEKMEPNLEPGN